MSVDTYKPEVAEAAIAAGASIVNDVSGLRDPRLAEVCARGGARARAHAHARGAQGDAARPGAYDDVVADVVAFLRERIALARVGRAVRRSRSCSTPGRTSPRRRRRPWRCCGGWTRCARSGRPLLLAVSRKDFLGAITGRAPAERDPATLAARRRSASTRAPRSCACTTSRAPRDFLAVRAVLRGERVLGPLEGLTPERYPDGVPPHLTLG